jgi:hypothetical protein
MILSRAKKNAFFAGTASGAGCPDRNATSPGFGGGGRKIVSVIGDCELNILNWNLSPLIQKVK